ncbi:hypothetical protein [Serratia fonticola]|uniref:hypothetical protein n=1 Tax=Serratia fonticola TaxID=47917 RepID=UPI0015C652F3|nr:hypothetical protein [Serratia fonticola]NYA11682.1 hypothetical protein [Serratia fonticola]
MGLRREHRAFQQGDLDCLCGAYSIVNAMTYLFDGRIKRKPLLRTLLTQFAKQWPLDEWLTQGIDEIRMAHIIETVLMTGYYRKSFPVTVTQPFNKRRIKTTRVVQEMQAFLGDNKDFSRVILFSNQYHWSVIKSMDEHFMYYLDSSGVHRAKIDAYALYPNENRYQFYRDALYFIERNF